jgi:uncharacterized protein (TIGR00290 family)
MKTLLSWSSGKDSAWALYLLQQDARYNVAGLLTTLNSAFDRVAMHSTQRSVLEAQADAANLPLHAVPLPWPCSNAEYESAMRSAHEAAVADGVESIAFGDLYLEDVRRYREDLLRGTGLTPIFPLWGLDTRQLLATMISSGLEARIVCLDPKKLPASFAGRALDAAFVHDLAQNFPDVDPCGENGEFHTCVTAGPMFRHALSVTTGETVERDGFVFSDVVPAV